MSLFTSKEVEAEQARREGVVMTARDFSYAVPEFIDDPLDGHIPLEYRNLQYWERSFGVAKAWYHEEWEGSDIQLALARDIAEAIAAEVWKALSDYV